MKVGKTYVYLRTILNLYQLYGFKKFIIVVPSIAIRKGVKIAITMLKDQLRRMSLEIMDDIMYHTMLPRLAIMKILWELKKVDMLQN